MNKLLQKLGFPVPVPGSQPITPPPSPPGHPQCRQCPGHPVRPAPPSWTYPPGSLVSPDQVNVSRSWAQKPWQDAVKIMENPWERYENHMEMIQKITWENDGTCRVTCCNSVSSSNTSDNNFATQLAPLGASLSREDDAVPRSWHPPQR